MSTVKIKKGDTVKVIAGADKDKEGKVIAVNHKNNTVIVKVVNMMNTHTNPSLANQNTSIVPQEALIPPHHGDYGTKGKSTTIGLQNVTRTTRPIAKATGEVID